MGEIYDKRKTELIEELKKIMDVVIAVIEPVLTMFIEFWNNLPELIQKYIMEEIENE